MCGLDIRCIVYVVWVCGLGPGYVVVVVYVVYSNYLGSYSCSIEGR